MSGMCGRTEVGARLPCDPLETSLARTHTQPAGRVTDATAGGSGDGAAGWLVAPTYIRSGQLAAADALLARAGSGDFHDWACWRDRHHDQGKVDYSSRYSDSKLPTASSARSFHH